MFDVIMLKHIFIWEVGGLRLEASSNLCGSNKPIMGLNLLVYAWTTEGYGFIEFEISNSTISKVFRQPLNQCSINKSLDNDHPHTPFNHHSRNACNRCNYCNYRSSPNRERERDSLIDYIYIYIYIYISREREREREIYIYIYIYLLLQLSLQPQLLQMLVNAQDLPALGLYYYYYY